jgi:hypothetical protein
MNKTRCLDELFGTFIDDWNQIIKESFAKVIDNPVKLLDIDIRHMLAIAHTIEYSHEFCREMTKNGFLSAKNWLLKTHDEVNKCVLENDSMMAERDALNGFVKLINSYSFDDNYGKRSHQSKNTP